MDEASPELKAQRLKEFMGLLPLTLELAGLPKCEVGKLFTDGQMEVRVTVLKNAFRMARQLAREVSERGVS